MSAQKSWENVLFVTCVILIDWKYLELSHIHPFIFATLITCGMLLCCVLMSRILSSYLSNNLIRGIDLLRCLFHQRDWSIRFDSSSRYHTVVEVLLLTRGKYHMHWERQTISNVRVTWTLFSCAFKARNNTADSWTPEAWSDCQTLLTDWQQRHEWRCWFLKTRGTKWHFADASCWDRSYGEWFTDAWH